MNGQPSGIGCIRCGHEMNFKDDPEQESWGSTVYLECPRCGHIDYDPDKANFDEEDDTWEEAPDSDLNDLGYPELWEDQ